MQDTTATLRAGRGVSNGSENAADHSAALATSSSMTEPDVAQPLFLK
jgi:hypothetical protein